MEEIWKDIPEYEGIYQASNFGQIRTTPGKITHTELHGVRHWHSRIMKGRGNNPTTGKRVGLWKNGKVKDWLVARLIAITFLGKPTKEANTVNHIDGNRFNNNIQNLEWLSIGDNINHAFDNDLHSSNMKIVLYNKNEELKFRSMAKAGLFIGRNTGYISDCLHKQKNAIHKNGTVYNIIRA